jgi:hypothetical protein
MARFKGMGEKRVPTRICQRQSIDFPPCPQAEKAAATVN